MVMVCDVSFLAKKKYCEMVRPGWLSIMYKVQSHEALSKIESEQYEQLKREMLNTVNLKAKLVCGLTKNNKKTAHYAYLGCLFIVKFSEGKGKIITIQRE